MSAFNVIVRNLWERLLPLEYLSIVEVLYHISLPTGKLLLPNAVPGSIVAGTLGDAPVLGIT